jgi:hypothetical protein
MNYLDTAIDRIHYLVERADDLKCCDMHFEARLLTEQAIDIAEELRNRCDCTSTPYLLEYA